VYWELTNLQKTLNKVTGLEKPEQILLELASNLFNEMCTTITNNILLKGHNVFLVQMPRDLSGEILKQISSFEDKLFEEIFELKKTKEDLALAEQKVNLGLQAYQEKETQLRDLATQFSRFSLK